MFQLTYNPFHQSLERVSLLECSLRYVATIVSNAHLCFRDIGICIEDWLHDVVYLFADFEMHASIGNNLINMLLYELTC